ETEWNRAAEGERPVLYDVVVGGGMPALDRALLHRVEDLQRFYDLSGRVRGNLELAFGQLADALAKECSRAVDRVETLGEAGGKTPLDLRRSLRDRRRGDGGGRKSGTCLPQESASFHHGSSLLTRSPPRNAVRR